MTAERCHISGFIVLVATMLMTVLIAVTAGVSPVAIGKAKAAGAEQSFQPFQLAQSEGGGAEAAAASLLAQWAMGWVFRTLEGNELPPELANQLGQQLGNVDVESVKQLMGQVRSADQAEVLLDLLKGQFTPQQRDQLRNARRQIENGLASIPLARRRDIYRGVADALPQLIQRHPEVKHFIPGVLEELGVDWRDITEHLSRQTRLDINRSN